MITLLIRLVIRRSGRYPFSELRYFTIGKFAAALRHGRITGKMIDGAPQPAVVHLGFYAGVCTKTNTTRCRVSSMTANAFVVDDCFNAVAERNVRGITSGSLTGIVLRTLRNPFADDVFLRLR